MVDPGGGGMHGVRPEMKGSGGSLRTKRTWAGGTSRSTCRRRSESGVRVARFVRKGPFYGERSVRTKLRGGWILPDSRDRCGAEAELSLERAD